MTELHVIELEKHQMGHNLKTGTELLTMRVDMICGVTRQKAFEQRSGNRQQASSFITVTTDRTSCERKKENNISSVHTTNMLRNSYALKKNVVHVVTITLLHITISTMTLQESYSAVAFNLCWHKPLSEHQQ